MVGRRDTNARTRRRYPMRERHKMIR